MYTYVAKNLITIAIYKSVLKSLRLFLIKVRWPKKMNFYDSQSSLKNATPSSATSSSSSSSSSSSFICLIKIKTEGVMKFTIMARRPQETTRLITEATSAVIYK